MSDQRVDVLHRGRRFEVHASGGTFHAQSHCKCGSTMSSGEWFPTVAQALVEASSNMDEHQSKCTQHAVSANPLAHLADSVGRATSLMEAQLAVSVYVARVRQKSQAST